MNVADEGVLAFRNEAPAKGDMFGLVAETIVFRESNGIYRSPPFPPPLPKRGKENGIQRGGCTENGLDQMCLKMDFDEEMCNTLSQSFIA